VHAEEELELRALVDEAELELASGGIAAAIRVTETLLPRLTEETHDELRDATLSIRAGALEAAGELEAAIETLTQLVTGREPSRTWLTNQIALVRCLREHGSIAKAISVGEAAIARTRVPGFEHSVESIQLIVTLASAYEFARDNSHAMRLCKLAIAAADELDSPLARASAYWNASVIEADRGEYAKALDLALIVIREFENSGDGRNLGRIRSLVAGLQLRLDPPDATAALATIEQADRELAWSAAGAVDVARLHYLRGEAYTVTGDHSLAREHLKRSEDLVPSALSSMAASIAVALGHIAFKEGNQAEARTEFQRAIMILSAIGSEPRAAELWLELGDLLRELGDGPGARDAYRRAAVTSGLQRRTPRLR
jgi:tetratricopeptide (TPR) repeat protein